MQIAHGRVVDAAAGGQLLHLLVQGLRGLVQWQQGRAGQMRALQPPGSSLPRQVCVCPTCTCMSLSGCLAVRYVCRACSCEPAFHIASSARNQWCQVFQPGDVGHHPT